jgi:uncharacterized protein YbjT (DUF2867 family)
MGHILVTGGTGKTGRRVVADLRGRHIPCVAASRSASGVGEVTFDWSDPVTWEYAIRDVDAAYLIAPMGMSDPASLMIQFIEVARLEGVRRFVLLSASILPAGGPAMGQVHQFLQSSGAEWAVLRPSWFMENDSGGACDLHSCWPRASSLHQRRRHRVGSRNHSDKCGAVQH